MPTVRDTAKLLVLQKRIKNLALGDQLRVAAKCLDDGDHDIAETLAGNIVDELRVLRMFGRKT